MKLRKRSILTVCLLLVMVLIVSGCAGEKTPYEINDGENFNVSVKFDANGGLFTTNTSVIVDSFNISNLQTNNAGQVEIALLSPDDAQRGKDSFKVYNNGYFLAGWYAGRTETKDAQGNTVYSYSDLWDFSADTLKVHASGNYTSSEPVMTLYAAWVPMFEIAIYDLHTGEYVDNITFNPNDTTEFAMPAWDQQTGSIDMKDFPARDGYTFNAAYLDEQGTQSIDTETITHKGAVNYENGTASNGSMKLYVDWTEGEWFHIYTAEQFVDNFKASGNYVIHADLDFADVSWPMVYSSFKGSIQGNGHTFKNISATQNDNSKTSAGLFGQLRESAVISDLTFENATFTIKKGARVIGSCFGVLAGQIDSGAKLTNVQFVDSALQIDSGCAFLSDDYSIGLVCGAGSVDGIDAAGITCTVVGENPECVKVTVDGTSVHLEFVSE